MDFVFHIMILVCIYAVLSISLDLIAGHAGLISLAQAAFYGLGAYTSALMTTRIGASFSFGIFAGMVVATLISFIVSVPSLRLRDDYFVLATFAFQMVIVSVLNNCINVTRGPLGVPGIPEPIIFGITIQYRGAFLLLSATAAVAAYIVCAYVSRSPFGRVLRAIREDEMVAKSAGKNTVRFKIFVFAIGSALAALAGSLYAHYVTYIDPSSFTVMESILVLSMVIIGGAGSLWGPAVGAVVLVVLPEILRFIGLPSSVAANVRQIIYGGLLVAFMMWRPQGLLGKYAFRSREAKE